MQLEFKQLIEAYQANLQDTLRNFSVGPEFLDTWVHDEDILKSLAGVFDAAEIAGIKETLSVVVEKALLQGLEQTWLINQLKQMGTLQIQEGPTQITYTVDFASGPELARTHSTVKKNSSHQPRYSQTAPASKDPAHERVEFEVGGERIKTHPIYRQALTQTAQKIDHEGPVMNSDLMYEASQGSIMLRVEVNANGTIQTAKHEGAQKLARLILDQFCRVITGIHIQEAADHGSLKTEFQLRDTDSPRPVDGINQAQNVEPEFSNLDALIRPIYRQWLDSQKKSPERNFWTDPIPTSWYQFPLEKKIRKIQTLLNDSTHELGVQQLDVVDLKNEVRAVIRDEQKEGYAPFHLSLLRLETHLKKALGFSVELLLEDRVDKNKRHQSRTENTEISLD